MRADSAGVEIAYEATGDGPPVILLHGFPDTGRLWRHQVPALADAGLRVIVPDLRGYGRSEKPDEVKEYGMRLLVGDVLAVLDDAGAARAHLVGHDWGAVVAWTLARQAPARVDHLVALSVGAPGAPIDTRARLAQYQKSWYMLLFQFPVVAEAWLSADGWANFRAWSGHPDADAVIAELEAGGSLTPALNYYRANLQPRSYLRSGPPPPPIDAPTLGVWSSADPALTEPQMTASAAVVAGPWRYERLEGPGHWLQLDAPDEVNRLLLDFLPT